VSKKDRKVAAGPRRGDKSSLFGLTVVSRIQAIVTLSQGAVRGPKNGYMQGLFDKGPQKPQLVALAVRREANETRIHVGVDDDGEFRGGGFSVSGVLTSDNAEATGKSILSLLGVPKDVRAIQMAGEKLLTLAEGESATFRRDDSKRLQITSGGGEE
jgi:hypothetical protein